MAYTQKKIQIIQKTGTSEYAQMMPETLAEQVISTAAGKVTATDVDTAITQLATGKVIDAENVNVIPKKGILTSNTVQGALEEIANAAASGGVTSVNGQTGAVVLEATDVGAEVAGAVATHNGASDAHTDIRKIANAAKESAQTANDAIGVINGKLPTMESNITNAQSKADEAYTLAEGRARAASFATESAMKEAISAAQPGEYKLGDNLFIEETKVPDYWISKVSKEKNLTYGYYDITPLETQKIDLTPYQKIEDQSLNTTSKTVPGAINEVKEVADAAQTATGAQGAEIGNIKQSITEITGTTIPAINKSIEAAQAAANAAQTDATTANTAIGDIIDGTTTVKQAENATTSDHFSAAKTIALTGVVTGTVDTDFTAETSITTKIENDVIKTANISDSQITSAKMADIATLKGGASGMSAFDVNSKGQITKVARVIEYDSGTGVPSADLAIGGLFFKIKQQ